jgi:hypothetical protein
MDRYTPKTDLRDGSGTREKHRVPFRKIFISTFVRGTLVMYGLAAIIEPAVTGGAYLLIHTFGIF